MEAIVKAENYEIYKLGKSIYKITFSYTSYSLVSSLVRSRLIAGSSTDEYYKTITFKAETVKTLHQYLHEYTVRTGKKALLVSHAVKVVCSLVKQLSYLLEKCSSTIIGYNIEDIIVINDQTFAFLGSDFVAKFDVATEMAMISCPFKSTDFFFSPEMFEITELPAYVHFKTAYYSLACLVINLLVGNDEYDSEYRKDKNSAKILEYLNHHPIKETKLYWLLSRCLIEDAKERSIILI
jgi:serine/threonine protein kinase